MENEHTPAPPPTPMNTQQITQQLEAQLTKLINDTIAARTQHENAKKALEIAWNKLTPKERIKTVKETLDLNITGTNLEELLDCLNC